MVSAFQFSNPSLMKLSYSINDNFNKDGNENINIEIKNEVEIGAGPEENSSVVILKLTIGAEDGSAPFYIYAEEAAAFRWEADKIDNELSDKLLKQNAPALLLSYLRPTISLITSASPFPTYDLPFMNFVE